jgi:thiol-disulfide isomerase/thioredoxin
MKKTTLITLFILSSVLSFGRSGYKIEVDFPKDVSDSVVYLAHFYAKNLPTIFTVDSAKMLPNNKVVFQKKDSILGGIYLIVYNHRSKIVEFVLNNGDDFSIDFKPGKNGSSTAVFKNSPENNRYQAYNAEMEEMGSTNRMLLGKLALAKNHDDTMAVAGAFQQLTTQQLERRKNYIKQYPNTFLSKVFKSIQSPEVPKGPHYLEDGKTIDSLFDYAYYKAHYWDNFDFTDDRLINTPVYDAKLNEYFSKWIYQIPDTINAEADKILKAAKNSKELFRYTLRTLTANALQSKIMGMDEVFVYLVEHYYMKGDAYWLSQKDLDWYEDRARKMSPTVMGNTAPELLMQDIFTLTDKPLSELKAKYTLVVVWSYDCPTCKKEVPKLDSVYNAVLKNKGVKIYSIASGGDLDKVQQFVKDNKIEDWTNVADINNNTNFKEKYDAYSTPKIYLLDENKKIIGKGLDHTNINTVIEISEKKKI